MAKVYYITGSLGAGKTLCGVDMARRYIEEGRKVATNVNLNLEFLCNPDNDYTRVMRVPDAPNISDLQAIGYGSSSSDEKTHGLLLLDELGTWFNARDFANKDRLKVIKWMIHMRKRRWDVAFIVQDFGMVDKQARGNIAQHLVICRSSKDLWIFKFLPKFHIGDVRHGSTRIKVDTWIYKGKDVYKAYDTEQLFYTGDDESEFDDSDAEMSAAERKSKSLNGLYCLLPPAYLGIEKQDQARNHFGKINRFRKGAIAATVGVIAIGITASIWPESQALTQQAETTFLTEQQQPGTIVTTPIPTEPLTFYELFSNYRITGYSQFGEKIRYDLDGPNGPINTNTLQTLGYTIRPRGTTEVLIVNQDYEYTSVFR